MVKYTVAASVAFVQLAMFTRTSVALPIEYPEGLESRAILNPNDQQLTERDNMELEGRNWKVIAGLAGAGLVAGAALHMWHKNQQSQNQQGQQGQVQGQQEGQQGQSPLSSGSEPKSPPVENRRRDLSDLDSRDWKEFVKRYIDELDRRVDVGGSMIKAGQTFQNTQAHLHNAGAEVRQIFHPTGGTSTSTSTTPPTGDPAATSSRRDLSDLYERDWDEYEKRGFNELEERDWNEFEERDWDDYEKRGFNEFEERDWNEFEERDWDDYEMEARGLDADELDELD